MCEDTDMDTPTVSMNYSSENSKKLYTKLSKLREISLKCDWSKDKKMMGGIASYPYLSAGKVKQTFAPLFVKAGLELDMSYGKPILLDPLETRNSRMQHWIVELNIRIIDIDTGFGTCFSSYWGEGTDVLDKGLRKAMTAAVKSWLSDMFFLEEGIDPEVSGTGAEISGTFVKQEEPEIKSKIADAAVKPAEKPVEPAPQPAPAEKPAKAPRAKKEPMTKKETPEPAKPAEPAPEAPVQPSAPANDLIPGSDTGYKVAGVQEKPLNKIITEWNDALANGKVTQARYDEMVKECRAIGENRAVMQFIVKYRRVE